MDSMPVLLQKVLSYTMLAKRCHLQPFQDLANGCNCLAMTHVKRWARTAANNSGGGHLAKRYDTDEVRGHLKFKSCTVCHPEERGISASKA